MTLPSRKSLVRSSAVGLTAALTASSFALLPAGSAQAAGVDPLPASAGAGWLRSQLVANLLPTGAATTVPDSLEAALGLKVAGDAATATAVRDAVAPLVAGYVAPGGDTDPNRVAQVAWYAQQLGADANTYGATGTPLAPRLLDVLATDVTDADDAGTGLTAGRLADAGDTTAPTTVTTAGQAYAAAALGAGGTTYAADATRATQYLAGLQCGGAAATNGAFNDALPAVAPAAQVCDLTANKQSVPATALVLIGINAGLTDVRNRATAWLLAQQQSNGRWVANGGAGAGDTLSTALAGYALRPTRPGAAAQGAVWLRGNQLLNAGTCAAFPAADVGAVPADGGTYAGTAGQENPFRVATARALLVLGVAPGGPGVTDNVLTVPRFSQPGKPVKATVRTAPRNLICASAPTLAPTRIPANYDSTADFTFTAGASGSTTASITDPSGQVDSATVTVLGQKKLGLTFRSKQVRVGKKAVAKVKGLAPGEKVSVKFRGQRKNSGIANAKGQLKLRFVVTGQRGNAKVKVTGEYDNRNRAKDIRVLRR